MRAIAYVRLVVLESVRCVVSVSQAVAIGRDRGFLLRGSIVCVVGVFQILLRGISRILLLPSHRAILFSRAQNPFTFSRPWVLMGPTRVVLSWVWGCRCVRAY